jgi:hypothetical protein
MATPYRLKRSSIASKRPKLTDLDKGELALNFYDGHLFAERDTAGVGIGTTIANLTPWKESFGGLAINYENSVGIGSTNPVAKLDVVGQTELDDLNVSGITTFKGNIDADGNLDVDGQTDLDVLNVAETATFSALVDINANLDVDGYAELDDLNVSGITTAVGGVHVGTGGTILSTGFGRVGINTTQAAAGYELEVYGNINIVGDDVEYYQNGARRTAGVGVHSSANIIAGFGATIIDFVGSAVSSITYNAIAGIATVNLSRGEFSRATSTFTASADQTSFTVSYTPGFVDVFVNGVRLTGADYTAGNGTSVVLSQPAFAGDIVDIVAFNDDGFVDSKWTSQDGTPANIFYTSGNVGINTAQPRQTLDVEGNANFTGIVTASKFVGPFENSGDFTIDDYVVHSGDTNTRFGFPADDTFIVDTSGSERFRITDVGRIVFTSTNSVQVAVGTEGQKDSVGTAVTGQIRYNTTNSEFEGFGSGGQWGSLGGVKDVDGDTFITAETSSGSDDDTLSFTAAGTVRAVVNASGVGIGTTIPRGDLDIGEQFSIKTTTTTVAATTASTIDTLSKTVYRSSRFQVQITQGTDYQSSDLMVIHDGTNASIIEYGSIATNNMLASFTSTISGSNLLLQVTMGSSSSSTIKVVRYGISI